MSGGEQPRERVDPIEAGPRNRPLKSQGHDLPPFLSLRKPDRRHMRRERVVEYLLGGTVVAGIVWFLGKGLFW